MKDRLAEVVDEVVITGQNTGEKMCSCESDVVDETCSSESYGACGDGVCTISDQFVRILDFRHFERHFAFSQSDRETYKKAVLDGVNVSVVLDVVSGNI